MKKIKMKEKKRVFRPFKKVLLMAKLTVLLLLIGFLQVSARTYSQSVKLSLKMENATILEVFEQIEKVSEYRFFYDNDLADLSKRTTIESLERPLADILDHIFRGTSITYQLNDRLILIKENTLSSSVLLQQININGKVTDEAGHPLPGVTVLIKGTNIGSITNSDGTYSLNNVPSDGILVFSFVGMKTTEINVDNNSIINVTLEGQSFGIEEVVAIGYGTQKKATVTGSIATVAGEELAKIPATNLSTALTGQMTGVIVNTRGSSPGNETVQINIRGKGSWQGNSSPLIIIDGIANRSGFEKINPNDIESISVLKDASAAIYGSRAANGVILVTTKRGKQGKPTIEYTGDFGLTQPTRVPEMTRSWQFATYYTEAKRNGFIFTDEEISKYKDGSNVNLYPNYDIRDYVLQNFAPQTTHTVSLRGGNEAVKYYVSGRYLYKDSYFKEGVDDYNSYNVRSNLDAQISSNLKVSIDINGRRDDVRRAVGSQTNYNWDIGEYIEYGFFDYILAIRPTSPIFYENGLPASIFDDNVVETIRGKRGIKNDRTTEINTQGTVRWDLPFIANGLFIEGIAAYDFANVRTKEFSKSYDLYEYDNSTGEYSNLNVSPVMNRGLFDKYYNSYKYTINSKLGYEKVIGDHSINTFIAYEQYSVNTEWIEATRSSFLSDKIPFLFAGDANTQKNKGSGSEFAYRNFFGRVAYGYKEKYLLDFALRRDESLKFAKDNRVGWFPGVSLGWRITEEPFMSEKFPFVDNLKLRTSFGQMGSDNVDPYQYLATAELKDAWGSYVLGATPSVVSTLGFTGTPNPNISWEVANTYNVALEGSIHQGLFGFELEYFYSKRSNILATRNASVPVYAGMSLPDENIGKAKNQGVELLLTHRKHIKDFTYNIRGNITYMSNKIIYMDESPNVPDYQKREDHPIDSWLLYKTDGIFNTQQELDGTSAKRADAKLGDIKYLDMNNDGKINDQDKVRSYESLTPRVVYGLNFSMEYNGFEFSMLWQGQADAKTYINPNERNGDLNVPMWMYNDRWTPENTDATMPRAFYHRSEIYNTLKSDFWLKNAAFIRLKNMELAYNIPGRITSKASIRNARVYVSGMNLLLIDKIKNYDPEVVNTLGLFYPATKVYNIGIRLTL